MCDCTYYRGVCFIRVVCNMSSEQLYINETGPEKTGLIYTEYIYIFILVHIPFSVYAIYFLEVVLQFL